MPLADIPFYSPPSTRMGDTFPIFRDGECHLFALVKPEGPETKLQIAHYTSRDLVHWAARPIAVAGGQEGEPDSQGCATGTVVQHEERFYLFYTGNQNVCLATSDDLDHWTKHPSNPILEPDGQQYTLGYFRDPFVFFNEDQGVWWMLFGSREAGSPAQRAGCVGLAKSKDLVHWKLHAPLWAPGIGPHTDCPQLVRHANLWYLFYLQRHTRYRIAEKATGPFLRPSVRDLNTPLAAAGSRLALHHNRWLAWPFVMNLLNGDELGAWDYGGPLAVPREMRFHRDGRITEHPLQEMIAAVHSLPEIGEELLAGAQILAGHWGLFGSGLASLGDAGGTLLVRETPADMYLEADVCLAASHMDAQLLLRVAEDLTQGYKLGLHPWMSQVSVRPISESDVDPLLESRFVALDAEHPIKLRVFLCGSILEVFVDDRIALTCRLYRHLTGGLAFEFRDGQGAFRNVTIRAL